jgi:hypothetical protein
MMPLGPRRAGLTACQPQLIFAYTDDFLDLGADAIEPAPLGGRER